MSIEEEFIQKDHKRERDDDVKLERWNRLQRAWKVEQAPEKKKFFDRSQKGKRSLIGFEKDFETTLVTRYTHTL